MNMLNNFRKARAIKALENADVNKHSHVIIKEYKDGEGYFVDYVAIGENINDYIIYNPNSNYTISEVYNLSLDIESQLNEKRSYHIEAYIKKEDSNELDYIRNNYQTNNSKRRLTKPDIIGLIDTIDTDIYKKAVVFEDRDKNSHIYFVKECDSSINTIANKIQSNGGNIVDYCQFDEFNLEKKAYEFALKKHNGKYRKGNNPEPYINHPLHVANLISYYFPNTPNLSDLKCAAYLHDVLEDTNTSFEEIANNFGYKIAYLVKELTSDDYIVSSLGKEKYLCYKLISLSEDALSIKLCDRLDNICSLRSVNTSFRSKYVNETITILNFLQEKRKLNSNQLRVIKDIISEMKKVHVVTKKLVYAN